MTGMDDNDPAYVPTYQEMQRNLETAWQLALKLYGCVECSRLDLAQRLRFMAKNKEQQIMGPVSVHHPAIVPIQKDGIARVCKNCQEPSGMPRTFKPGTDEFADFEDFPDDT